MKSGASECRGDQRLGPVRPSAYFYALAFRARSDFRHASILRHSTFDRYTYKQNSRQLVDNIDSRSFLIETLSAREIV
jgi:hypothetical protein